MVIPPRNNLQRGRVGGRVLQSSHHSAGSRFAIRKGFLLSHTGQEEHDEQDTLSQAPLGRLPSFVVSG